MKKCILKVLILSLVTISVAAFGESELSSNSEVIQEKAKSGASKHVKESNPLEIEKTKKKTNKFEAISGSEKSFGLHGSFSYLDTWLPGKLGVVLTYGDKSRIYEFGYQKASYSFDVIIDDLGTISDQRIYLSTRSHTWGGSFNFQYGAYYNKFSAELGNAYTSLVSSAHDLVEVQTVGVLWGLGNKWNWGSWEFASDWFKVFYPVVRLDTDADFLDQTNDDSDKDEIEKLLDTVAELPTFSLFHVELGYRF